MTADSSEQRSRRRHLIEAAVSLTAGAYGIAFFGEKLGLMPASLADLGLVTRGAVITAAAFVVVTLFSVAVGLLVAEYLRWRHDHLDVIREVINDGE